MPLGWAIAGAAVVGAAGSVIAGGEQASGEKQAAQTQANELGSIQQLEHPFVQGGYGAETSLQNLLYGAQGGTDPATGLPNGYLTQQFNPTQAQLNAYPGYQFQQQAGQLATESANTPGSGALSGSALKSLMSFNQGLAASNYQNYFNQFQTQQNNIFNRLSGIAQLGQAGASGVASAGTQLGTGIAQAQAGAAGATAGGIVGATNSVGGAANTGLALNYLLGNNPNSLTGVQLNTNTTPWATGDAEGTVAGD